MIFIIFSYSGNVDNKGNTVTITVRVSFEFMLGIGFEAPCGVCALDLLISHALSPSVLFALHTSIWMNCTRTIPQSFR